jgi:hypothetical protein
MLSIFIALKVLCNVVAGELRLCGVLALSAVTRTSVASQRSMRYVGGLKYEFTGLRFE